MTALISHHLDTHNFLPGLKNPHLAEPNVEGRRVERAIFILHNYNVDSSRQRRSVNLRVKILKVHLCIV